MTKHSKCQNTTLARVATHTHAPGLEIPGKSFWWDKKLQGRTMGQTNRADLEVLEVEGTLRQISIRGDIMFIEKKKPVGCQMGQLPQVGG